MRLTNVHVSILHYVLFASLFLLLLLLLLLLFYLNLTILFRLPFSLSHTQSVALTVAQTDGRIDVRTASIPTSLSFSPSVFKHIELHMSFRLHCSVCDSFFFCCCVCLREWNNVKTVCSILYTSAPACYMLSKCASLLFCTATVANDLFSSFYFFSCIAIHVLHFWLKIELQKK